MGNKEEINYLKVIKHILESTDFHTQFNFMTLHILGYSSSIKDYFNAWRLKRDIKKIEKQIKKLEKGK